MSLRNLKSPRATSEPIAQAGDWDAYVNDETGITYYFNRVTNEST